MSQTNQDLKKAIDKIESAEEKIELNEAKILEEERKILSSVKETPVNIFDLDPGTTKRKIHLFRLTIIKKIARHKLLYGIVVTISLVLIWRGLWHTIDELPIISISLVSLGVGLLSIWILKKYTDLH
ncbi:hypothetical protein A2631_00450 [Candidatus Daviesbacteria bacterium RIFCSPHIGHO2_01_FULL_44_29]|uniref:Uncharacterized protein n=1 Tax=Candidatus Daviesbacteria bacterium RIFCSPHIGHO2_02_FULL_43_12 TaxID=1797776 RepID=A0A1F5KHH7_9BACT|nr:MAG: hypothetical protein A2631_00450 [Candidatus Daviesbacteria bacterium RIFCSPHIGHO2_01_FULL_44_29]OGE40397.1 MAG: hypothetical protein A3D25_00015 [Candidatus Daviesbacteria bacterium RIFCSPHIGHO2_02_FULL_43_12]OGE41015.1 MAG: hypothetical protein A3E86_02105 [Candidatus Daviesbacteria bacterium RIFCSPHIGHO2_12_FULL_47_45]OGE69721.1 MAG: hypothetical protein A3B55_01995 [Candidatus Daviesbacteria bacterium RIFCSPLOWO2_01_FULL_43_15]